VHNFGTYVWSAAAQWQNPKKKTCFDVGKIGFCLCAAVLRTQVPTLSTSLDLGLLYILISGTYSKFARKNIFLSLGVCFPQLRSSAGRRFAASRRSRVQYYNEAFRFHNKNFDEIRCKLDSTENPLSFEKYSNTQPHLEVNQKYQYKIRVNFTAILRLFYLNFLPEIPAKYHSKTKCSPSSPSFSS